MIHFCSFKRHSRHVRILCFSAGWLLISALMSGPVWGNDGYVIMMPAFNTADEGSHWMRVSHRFNGPISNDLLRDSFGMDQGSRVRLQWDWAATRNRQFSLSRTSPTGIIEASWRENWWLSQDNRWRLLSVLGTSIQTGQKEGRDGRENSVNLDLMMGYQSDPITLTTGIRAASQTNPGFAGESEGSLGAQLAATANWNSRHAASLELLQPMAGFRGSNRNPRIVAAWDINTGFHRFRITLPNHRHLNSHEVLAPLAMPDSRDAYAGFVISRRF